MPASLDVSSDDCFEMLDSGVMMVSAGRSGTVSLNFVGETSMLSSSKLDLALLLLGGLDVGVGGSEDVLLLGAVP